MTQLRGLHHSPCLVPADIVIVGQDGACTRRIGRVQARLGRSRAGNTSTKIDNRPRGGQVVDGGTTPALCPGCGPVVGRWRNSTDQPPNTSLPPIHQHPPKTSTIFFPRLSSSISVRRRTPITMFALRSAGSILRQRTAPPLVATVQVNAHANGHTSTAIALGVAGLAGMAALPATRTRAPVRWARRAFVRLNSGVAGVGRVGLRAAGAVGRLGKRTLPGRMAGQAVGRLYPGRAARAVTRLRASGRTIIRFNSTQAGGRRLPPSATAKDGRHSVSASSTSTTSPGGSGSGGSGGGSGGSGKGKGKESLKGEWYEVCVFVGNRVLVLVLLRGCAGNMHQSGASIGRRGRSLGSGNSAEACNASYRVVARVI